MKRLLIVVMFTAMIGTKAHAAQVIGGRPAACAPYKQTIGRYCGCALSIMFFGRPRPDLFLAVRWKRFQRVQPAPDMVAARSGHVMKLLHHVSGSVWRVYDPNGGRGLTWIHDRSVRGYTFHNPRAYANAN